MRRGARRALALAVGVASALAGEGRARAQAAPGLAVELFDPAPAGDRFMAARDGSVLGLFDLHASALASYAVQPLGRYRAAAASEPVTRQLWGHVNVSGAFAYGVLLNLDLPCALAQAGTARTGAGLGDTRLGLRLNLLGGPKGSVALGTAIDVWLPTGSAEKLTGDGTSRAEPRLALSGERGHLVYAANLGVQLRREVDLGPGREGRALSFAGALGVKAAGDALLVGLEIFGRSATSALFDPHATPWEVLASTRVRAGDLLFGFGFGAAPLHAADTMRAVASVTFSPDRRVRDHDGDGVDDAKDACPRVPGLGPNGCPLPDRDGDSIDDAKDACPDEPGLVHVDPRKHGCPPARPAR